MISAILWGKPRVGNPHVRLDDVEVASAMLGRRSLLYTRSAWRRAGVRLDVRKLKGVLCAVAGVLLGTSAALAEMVILPSDLPGGTEGVAYDSEKDPCLLHLEEEKGVAMDVERWSVAQFKLGRESNTFASLGGTREWFDKAIASPDENGRLPLDLGFDFPIAGATFSQVNVGAWGAGVWAGGGKGGGPELVVSPGNVAWGFDCTSNPYDGIFIETGSTKDKDPVRFTTIKWVGHAPSKEGDPAPLNFAVTLYADGRVRFIYGACGDPNDKEKSFQAGRVSVFGSNGNDRGNCKTLLG